MNDDDVPASRAERIALALAGIYALIVLLASTIHTHP